MLAKEILEDKPLTAWKICPIMFCIFPNFAFRSVTCCAKIRKLLPIVSIKFVSAVNGIINMINYEVIAGLSVHLLAKKTFASLLADFSKLSAGIIIASKLDFFLDKQLLAKRLFF